MTRGAFALITNSTGHVFLVRSLTSVRFKDHWSIPGGVVEDGETFEQGCVRETLEEVGLVIELGVRLCVVRSDDNDLEAVTFKASYISGEIQLQTHEIEAAQWFTVEEAKKLKLGFNIAELLLRL